MRKLFIISILFIATQAFSQKNPEKELGVWYMYGGSHKFSSKFSLKSLAHFRFFDFGDDLQQLLIRVGGNYKINNTLSATLGYAYLNTDATFGLDGGNVNEHRIYEDFNINHKLSELGFAHRFRLEHRFFDTNTSHWIRYQLALSHPLSEKWSTYIYDEIFFNFEGEAFNQNWFGLGFKYKVSKAVKLQFGYMNIATSRQNFNRLQVGISLSTNHQKKK